MFSVIQYASLYLSTNASLTFSLQRALKIAARATAGISAATGGMVLWQYYKVRKDYKKLPTPDGPLFGVEFPSTSTSEFSTLAVEADTKHSTQCQLDAKNKTVHVSNEAGDCGAESVVFIGDSLVMGIGCLDDEKGPVFSREFAQVLATERGHPVRWRSFGVDGGDLNRMKAELLGSLRLYSDTLRRQAGREQGNKSRQGQISTVVIMCGLNDYKNLIVESRLPSEFRANLKDLISQVRDIIGKEVRVIVPGIPVNHAPLFKKMFPFNLALYSIAKEWDRQKQILAQEEENVVFIDEPPEYTPADWAVDGVHPSARGYKEWANHIACRTLSSEKNSTFV